MNEIISPDIRAQYRFWTEEKLRNADTDLNGHVNNAVMSSLYEGGRIEVLNSPEIAAVRAATRIVVAKTLVNFRKELFYPGKVMVGTRVSRVGRSSMEFEQAIFAVNGEVSNAEVACVLLDRESRKPTPVPDEMRAYLTGI